jgi:hypothetical protein
MATRATSRVRGRKRGNPARPRRRFSEDHPEVILSDLEIQRKITDAFLPRHMREAGEDALNIARQIQQAIARKAPEVQIEGQRDILRDHLQREFPKLFPQRVKNYPRSKYWHTVADADGILSVAYTGTMSGAQAAGKRLVAKGYQAHVMPAEGDEPRGWRKEWKVGIKNPSAGGPICYLQINTGRWAQESYDTNSGDARVRAGQLRKAGYKVTVVPMGNQVTSVGRVKMTMVDVRPGTHEDTEGLPPVRVERNPAAVQGGRGFRLYSTKDYRHYGGVFKTREEVDLYAIYIGLLPDEYEIRAGAADWYDKVPLIGKTVNPMIVPGLPKNSLMQYPTGRWGFVGSVDPILAYARPDGSIPSRYELMQASKHGPKLAGVVTRTWATQSEAEEFLASLGHANPSGDIQDRFSSQLADRLWPQVTSVGSKGELHEEIHQAMHGVSEPGRVGNPEDWMAAGQRKRGFGVGIPQIHVYPFTETSSDLPPHSGWSYSLLIGGGARGGGSYLHYFDDLNFASAEAAKQHALEHIGKPGYGGDSGTLQNWDKAKVKIHRVSPDFLGIYAGQTAGRRGRSRNPVDSSASSLFESFHGTPSTSVSTVTETEEYPDNLATLGQLVELKVHTLSKLEATIQFGGNGSGRVDNPRGDGDTVTHQLWYIGPFRTSSSEGADAAGMELRRKGYNVVFVEKSEGKWYIMGKSRKGQPVPPHSILGNWPRMDKRNPPGVNGDAPTLASSPDGRQLYIVGGDQSLDLSALKMSGKKWERDSMVLGVLDEFTYRTEKGFDNFKMSDYYHHAGEESGVQPMLVYDNINRRLSIVGGQYRITLRGVEN